MQYIGKKQFHSIKWIQRNKKKKKTIVESDWKTYYGSNETLKSLVQSSTEQSSTELSESFYKEILYICYSKSEASYYEAKMQFESDVILSDKFFNDWISVKVTRKHLKRLQI
jgi:hypothetical protein